MSDTDPYYFLQYSEEPSTSTTPPKYMPSFLSMDVDGRVLRVDRQVYSV